MVIGEAVAYRDVLCKDARVKDLITELVKCLERTDMMKDQAIAEMQKLAIENARLRRQSAN